MVASILSRNSTFTPCVCSKPCAKVLTIRQSFLATNPRIFLYGSDRHKAVPSATHVCFCKVVKFGERPQGLRQEWACSSPKLYQTSLSLYTPVASGIICGAKIYSRFKWTTKEINNIWTNFSPSVITETPWNPKFLPRVSDKASKLLESFGRQGKPRQKIWCSIPRLDETPKNYDYLHQKDRVDKSRWF